ncbi:MAG: phage holin family protein, partial [Candidatus Gastranaerophilaceae bacterium]
AFITAATISFVNISLKPALTIITLPINIFTLGLFTLVINALLLMFVAFLVPGFEVDGFLSAFLGSLMLSILSVGLSFI